MHASQMTHAMIKTAVSKSISDIRVNTTRGLRNLVDLGERFASGEHHRGFIAVAQQTLLKPRSAYFRLAKNVVTGTSRRALTTFGVNLGYYSLSHGASIIRRIEAADGHNIPWCLGIELKKGGAFTAAHVTDAIGQGTKLGIYFYMIYMREARSDTDELIDRLARERSCSFVLMTEPLVATDALLDRVAEAGNIAVAIDLEAADGGEPARAIEALKARRCLYGGFMHIGPAKMDDERIYRRLNDMDVPFLLWLRREAVDAGAAEAEYRALCALRKSLKVPVLPIDLYGDIALIDRNISTCACLAWVCADGEIMAADAEAHRLDTGYNLLTTSLKEALARCAVKEK